MLPRFSSSCTNREFAKATRRSNVVRKTLSGLPGFGLRDSQNFSTNSSRSAVASDTQVFFSSAVMSQRTGPSAQNSSAGSLRFGGALNSWNALKRDGEPPLDLSAGAEVDLRAASNAAIAFFEYIAGSIVAFG